jgi:hypothetical protein
MIVTLFQRRARTNVSTLTATVSKKELLMTSQTRVTFHLPFPMFALAMPWP